MKCSKLSFVVLVVAQFSVALFVPESNGLVVRQNNRFGGNRGGGQNGGNNNQNGGNNNQNGGNNNQNGGNNNQNGGNSTQNGGNNNQNGGNNTQTGGNNNQNGGNNNQNGGGNNGTTGNGGNGGSLTLDPSVIQNINGKAQAAGEADSLVSNNNFIDFCVGKTITNGKQVQGGSCNPTPMGDIPSVDNMPSCKFAFPPNNGNVGANTAFTVVLNTQNMQTGAFSNAANTYYAAPQQLNGNGQIIGHNHVVIEQLQAIDSTQPTNPRVFAFFKGLNAAANNGQLTADVTNGLAAGAYRICSITSAENHQSVLAPVAQRGSMDDCSYFNVGQNGGNNAGNNTQNGGNNGQNGGNNAGNNGQNGVNNAGNNTQNGVNNGGKNNQNGGNNGQNGRRNGRNGRRYERRFFTSH